MTTNHSIALTLISVLAATAPGHAATAASDTGVATLAVSAPAQVAIAPDVAVGPRGDIAILWVDKAGDEGPMPPEGHRHTSSTNLYVAVSTDGGTSFGAPVRVNSGDGGVWGFAVSRPRLLFAPNGTLHVSFPANEIETTLDKPVLTTHYTRSTDRGHSFEAARRLSTLTTADLSHVIHGGFASAAAFGTLGVAPDGSVHVAWIDTRLMKSEADFGSVFGVVSRDDGRTFAPEAIEVDDRVCPCCQLSLTFDAESRPYLGSREVTGDNIRSASVAVGTSSAGSASADTFSKRVAMGGPQWKIAGCPLKPTVAAVRGRTVFVASHNGAAEPPGILFATSRDGGATFGEARPVHPGAQVSDAPTIALSGDSALLAWHAKAGGARRVFYRTLDAAGDPVGAPIELATPPGTSQTPALATRADGRVQIVWVQDNRVWTSIIEPARASAAPSGDRAVALITPSELERRLAAERGQVVVMNLWATWCAPCLKEIPELEKLARDLGPRGLTLFGVAMDEPSDLVARVEPFRAKYFPGFPTYARASVDLDAIAAVVDPAWNEVLPTTYVLARDGSVHARLQGSKSYDEFRAAIETAL